MAAGPGRTAGCASLSAPRRAPRPGFYVSVATKAGRVFLSPDPEAQPGVSPMPSTNGEGLGRSLGCAHPSAWDPSPALKMAPGRCLPSDCGHPGSEARAGRGQRSGRA